MTREPDNAEPHLVARPVPLVAAVTEHPDGRDECTLFPLSVSSPDERRSAWMTARGDAFAHLESFR